MCVSQQYSSNLYIFLSVALVLTLGMPSEYNGHVQRSKSTGVEPFSETSSDSDPEELDADAAAVRASPSSRIDI